MRPVGWIGVVLIVLGLVVLAMGGMSYRKESEKVAVGPVSVTAERRGFVPPVVGYVAIAVGAALVFAGRRSKA
jgi:hypothetical protein